MTNSTRGSSRAHRLVGAAAAACLSGAAVLLVVAGCAQQSAPQPPQAAPSAQASSGATDGSAPPTSPSHKPASAPAVSATPVAAPVALPARIRIPAAGVDSALQHLGLADDGSVAVPAPGPHYDEAAWFTGSPRPGAVGPAVVEGHVDSVANGPSVFFRLGALSAGDTVTVNRADGSHVTFTVYRVVRYPKDDFPTLAVYGNTAGPELRLITCGGDFDAGSGHYRDNTVVFARLA